MESQDRIPKASGDPPARIGLSDMDKSSYLSMGAVYILCVDSLMFPLDTLKTIIMSDRQKLQNGSRTSKSPGLLKMTIRITKKEGINRFWQGKFTIYVGFGPSVLGTFPGQST